jgi:alpha-galactosidase
MKSFKRGRLKQPMRTLGNKLQPTHTQSHKEQPSLMIKRITSVGFLVITLLLTSGQMMARTVHSTPVHRYTTARDSVPNLQNGLAKTPPMGWNSWNHFGCDINEDIIKQMADAMVKSGMKAAGYEYINIDDCWMTDKRDSKGRQVVNHDRFPHGIKWLADYVHSKGLKLGIYSSAGTETCQGLPASLHHEQADAKMYAKWGIDYLKYDNCHNQGEPYIKRYATMARALLKTGRPIVYSICEWGRKAPWQWAPKLGNLWRTTHDIRDNWQSMMGILDRQVGLYKYAGPGHWNDPDMLEVGNGGMSTTEYKAHFSLWAILAAPLIAGNDLRDMSPETKSILENKAVIAVDQDPKGIEGHKVIDQGDQEVWVKPLHDGSMAVLLLNRGPKKAFMTATAEQVGLPKANYYKETNLWTHHSKRTDDLIRGQVPSHGVLMFRVWPK